MYFTEDRLTRRLLPEQDAAGSWHGGSMMRGVAVSAALARGAEQALDTRRYELQAGRWTVDLCRPVWMRPLGIHAKIIRSGRRLAVVDVTAVQDDRAVARARALFLHASAHPTGTVWQPQTELPVPPVGLRPITRDRRLYHTASNGWTQHILAEPGSPLALWVEPTPVVHDEEPTPFQFAAATADLANIVTQLGTAGLEHINADLSLHLARPVQSRAVGLLARERMAQGAVDTGCAVLYDEHGPAGLASVTTMSVDGMSVDAQARDRARGPAEVEASP